MGGGVGNVVAGNYIGTDAAGTVALANGRYGVYILEAGIPADVGTTSAGGATTSGSGDTSGSGGGKSNVVGGTAAGAGNVISGNGASGIYISGGTLDIVAGNVVGMNAAGTATIPNGNDGVELANGASGNTIGAGNVISGNVGSGVDLSSATGNLVEGNFIGTDITGTMTFAPSGAPFGNSLAGVTLEQSSTGNTIGGTTAGAANVISGNEYGIYFFIRLQRQRRRGK